mmetsp:Transcript_21028/g.53911  ORF Transcript_21028/g.53911 Transcript_21028/m.53911 type:complete len:102 (-) Transcript_21028:1516-1821(-)
MHSYEALLDTLWLAATVLACVCASYSYVLALICAIWDFFCETCPDGTGSFTVCACCGNFGASRPCTQCNAAYYCDKQCQKRHKKLHRKQCSGGGGGGRGRG